MLPFSHDAFVDVFRLYNQAIWPAQVVAYGLAGLALASLLRPSPGADRLALGLLAGMWLWTGILYHGLFFSAINGAAIAFALVFALQGGFFAWLAVRPHVFAFTIGKAGTSLVGLAFVIYAMLVYPLVGALVGQTYPGVPVFGVAPCPVVIFTFGMLLLARRRVPVGLLVIPGLWSLIGGSAAFLLSVPQDWSLLFSGVVAIPLILRTNRGISARAAPA
jgi:hypothetical protein